MLKDILKKTSLHFEENVQLSKFSTIRATAVASFLVYIENLDDIQTLAKIIRDTRTPYIFLGEGSNTLFSKDIEGVVIVNRLKGYEVLEDTDQHTTIKIQSGENWHQLVEYTVNNNLVGIENLALIPGTVGAAPMQNIAAYGQVQEDCFVELEAFDISTGKFQTYNKTDCKFAYRTSVFKHKNNSKFITDVTYKFRKDPNYSPDTSYHSRYESLNTVLKEIAKPPYTLKDVFNAVITIRKQKMPQPDEVGTLGSFFANPFVSIEKLKELQIKFPNIQYYPVDKMQYPNLQKESHVFHNQEVVKIPAGWILEELGWRGKRVGNVGTSSKHALIVTTEGTISGKEILEFTQLVQKDVLEKTGIELLREIIVV